MTAASCLYEGAVVHSRTTPVQRRFGYRLYFAYLDLDELPELFANRWLWSAQRPNLVWFRRADHLGPATQPLAGAVRDLVQERLGWRPAGPIRLLTQLRHFGFQMNPVSFYYCFDANGQRLQAMIAEVHNTPWNECHCYVLDVRGNESEAWHTCQSFKEFHVSPFLSMQLIYDFRLSRPGQRLIVRIQANQREAATTFGQSSAERSDPSLFQASLALRRVPINRANCRRVLLHYPLMTSRIFMGIYAQALHLWWKGVPVVPHPNAVASSLRSSNVASVEEQTSDSRHNFQDFSP